MHKLNKNKQRDTTHNNYPKFTVSEEAHATPVAPTRYGEAYPAWDEAPKVHPTKTTTLAATSAEENASRIAATTVATANNANLSRRDNPYDYRTFLSFRTVHPYSTHIPYQT